MAMSIFEHYVTRCAIAHQTAIRAARMLEPHEHQTEATKRVSELTIALIDKMHRLSTLVAEMGAEAVFGTPPKEIDKAELDRLLP